MYETLGTFFNLSISYLSSSNFKLSKSVLLAKSDVSTPIVFLNLLLLHD